MRDSRHDGRLGVTVREDLPCVLSRETATLEILLRDQLVQNIYRHRIVAEICYKRTNNCIDLFVHMIPDMRILVIGAGPCGVTLPVIDTPKQHGQ